jgi:hypothetical protein
MQTRAVEEAETRLRELRREELGDVALALIVFALAVLATRFAPLFAIPLVVGGLFALIRAVRADWRRSEYLGTLGLDRDAYSIPAVRALGARDAMPDRRRGFASVIRALLSEPGFGQSERLEAFADDLKELAGDLDNESLTLDPFAAFACERFLLAGLASPLHDPKAPPEHVRWEIRRIRSGFRSLVDRAA